MAIEVNIPKQDKEVFEKLEKTSGVFKEVTMVDADGKKQLLTILDYTDFLAKHNGEVVKPEPEVPSEPVIPEEPISPNEFVFSGSLDDFFNETEFCFSKFGVTNDPRLYIEDIKYVKLYDNKTVEFTSKEYLNAYGMLSVGTNGVYLHKKNTNYPLLFGNRSAIENDGYKFRFQLPNALLKEDGCKGIRLIMTVYAKISSTENQELGDIILGLDL